MTLLLESVVRLNFARSLLASGFRQVQNAGAVLGLCIPQKMAIRDGTVDGPLSMGGADILENDVSGRRVNSGQPHGEGTRVWVDGCFDLMHYGHANALRQAKSYGNYLVVGVHSNEEITRHKGPPVTTEEERRILVESCKWVDKVVMGAPYITNLKMMDDYNCQICVHGDDISISADGKDSYDAVKTAGRFVECKRTPSISTTELVGRMLLLSTSHHHGGLQSQSIKEHANDSTSYLSGSKVGTFTTSQKIVQFSNGKEPKAGDVVIYVDGAFDLFHAGHVDLLKQARSMGDFLLVGIHDDATINKIKGANYPILNLHERALSVLSCRYVDEVILGAPYSVNEALLDGPIKISIVVHGATEIDPDLNGSDPYEIAKQRGIYRPLISAFPTLSTKTFINRIIANRIAYEERNRKKIAKDQAANFGKSFC